MDVPGLQHDGAVRLPNQWFLRPAGKQILVGDFPANMVIHPSGKFAAVLHCGYGQHEIIIVDLKEGKLVSRAGINQSFYGIHFSQNGDRVFCSGAGDESVHSFHFKDGYLSEAREIKLRDAKYRAIPGGIATTSDGKTLFVANVWGHRVTQVNVPDGKVTGEVLLGTNDLFVVAEKGATNQDDAAITKRAEAALENTESPDPFPYACVLDEQRGRLYVSLWGQASVAVIDTKTLKVLDRWKTEEHPNDLVLSRSGKLLFVANANRNSVSIIDTQDGRMVEKLLAELRPNSPPGTTPNSVALSPDEKTLYVANANINTVAVFDVSEPGKSKSLGFIPVGWYPTSVRVTPDGKQLIVANGKGVMPKSNRHGPQPGEKGGTVREYIAGLLQGTIEIINLPGKDKKEDQLKKWTATAYSCMPHHAYQDGVTNKLPEFWTNPVPRALGGNSPIQYVIYIIKENRTYDQILGDMPEGNGDASICLFPQKVTPNHHQLARDFVLLDNFYVESEVSADGHEWTMGAYATDFVEKTWPLSYGHNTQKKFPYPAEGNFGIAVPAGGYLWDRAKEAGVSYRSYGEFVNNGKKTNNPATSRVKALQDHFDPWFRGFDMDYPDLKRAERFISELKRFEKQGGMPRLQIVRLPNDHTSGTAENKPTPSAYVADNDRSLGMVLQAISHSAFWAKTAVFIVEDDAQNGPDHVDAHRTIAFVISPYVKRHSVDSTLYSTSSMLRTMELILGLKPMSQFDAAALPMFNSFQAEPDLRPYEALAPQVDLKAKNSKTAWGRKLSNKMNFTKEDAADDLKLNEIIWRSVKGKDSPMPPPTRAGFVFAHPKDDDDD
ncbi:MAG: Phosphoesterase family protein [Verrucomicrobiales bacterium]|nr:Phosphoesterase family protein [Verrucomicrobiales bacterium]